MCSSDGEVETSWLKPMKVRSTWETTIHIKSEGADGNGYATHLRIDGNPSKFLQGHNVFGSDDFLGLVNSLVCHLPIRLTVEERFALLRGDFEVNRIDINYMFDLQNQDNVESWIRAAEQTSKTRHGRGELKHGTLYWGKHSRRWSMKAYSKFSELQAKDHGLPSCLPYQQKLTDFAFGKLRLELTLRRMELQKLGLNRGSAWKNPDKVRTVYNCYLERLEMTPNCTLSDNRVLAMKRSIQGTYLLWSQGINVKDRLSKATFYRHRDLLLEHGVDVALPCSDPTRTNVVPLMRPLEAVPVEVPQWAHDKRMVFDDTQTQRVAVGQDFEPIQPHQMQAAIEVAQVTHSSNAVHAGRVASFSAAKRAASVSQSKGDPNV